MTRDNALRILSNLDTERSGLTRREILRRTLVGLGMVMTGPLHAVAHPVLRHISDGNLESAATTIAGDDWKPEFLTSPQNDAVVALAEAIVPGSTQALVNRVLDRLLTVETAANRQKLIASLNALEAESQKRFQHPLGEVTATQMSDLLSACCAVESNQHASEHESNGSPAASKAPVDQSALREHFDNLKNWFVAIYYSSEQGMRELGWADEFYFESPAECPHPEEHR